MITPEDVRRIAAIESPVLRNLEITYAYSRLAAALGAQGANWCAFATWASRQAGRTIRGEDAIGYVEQRLKVQRAWLHPFAALGRRLLRHGLFDPQSRIGRLTARLHTPFDALERASDAVARGNRKVFEEIGYEFARYLRTDLDPFLAGLRDGDPPDGQRLLRSAFTRYANDPSPQQMLLANLEIGLHEQTRLQPEIREAMDAAYTTKEDLGRRLCPNRRPRVRRAVATLAMPAQRTLDAIARELITHSLMVLTLPGRVLALGAPLDEPVPEALRELTDAELAALFERFGGDVRDWSDLDQRMCYIARLFRAFHLHPELFDAPFTPTQVEQLLAGRIPDGDL